MRNRVGLAAFSTTRNNHFGITSSTELMGNEQKMHSDRDSVLWIQWTSSGNPTGLPETMGIDALIVDRRDLRILFRVASSGPAIYGVTRHGEDETEHYRIDIAGDTAAQHHLEGNHPAFDFASFQFVFPFLKLEKGRAFRMLNIGQPPDLKPRELAVRVAGRIPVVTAKGEKVEVWDVQVVPAHRRSMIHFYVTKEAPFFYGWDYQVAGGSATTMRLFDWQPMLTRTPPGDVARLSPHPPRETVWG